MSHYTTDSEASPQLEPFNGVTLLHSVSKSKQITIDLQCLN